LQLASFYSAISSPAAAHGIAGRIAWLWPSGNGSQHSIYSSSALEIALVRVMLGEYF